MHNAFTRPALPGVLTLLAVAAAVAAVAVPATAATHRAPSKVYVATHGKAGARDTSCATAAFSTVSAADSAVVSGGEVIVCGGTYAGSLSITKPLTLLGQSHAAIAATGKDNGILIRASHIKVSGFTVTGAIGEGILVQSADYVTIQGNVVTVNDQGALPVNAAPNTYAECQAQGGVPGDCGEGIHLMGSSYSTVTGNVVTDNSGGILLSDETGPTAHNQIIGNLVADNLGDCGVTVVGHNPKAAPSGVPAPKVAGIYDNTVSGNIISGNGTRGDGAGVVLATGAPGGAVYDNTVERNTISGNGLSGVTVHSHVPGQFLNGNVVTDNVITVNNLDGDNDFAPHTDDQATGVLVASVGKLSIDVSGNEIVGNHFGIWTTGPVTVKNANSNLFEGATVKVAQG